MVERRVQRQGQPLTMVEEAPHNGCGEAPYNGGGGPLTMVYEPPYNG